MRFDLITALPALCSSPLQQSIVQRAQDKGLVDIRVHDLRQFATGKHLKVDDYQFGGGAGMVLKPEPLFDCIEALLEDDSTPPDEVIFLTPDGECLDQQTANRLSLAKRLILIAGHYKGIDQRVRDQLVTREISIGDYVLSGGELPAMVLVDAVVRLIPGVLNDAESALSDSFQDGLLDAPAYTRPAEYRGMRVPDVLLSGDHGRVSAWREEQKMEKTRLRRPDLLQSTLEEESHPPG
ncbi:MAG: tRNA (guanine37-N1)-methyltransferase [Rhodothermales bacterium]|jgi:tRNA (guanine37-N1)-methyltransferase